MSFHTDLLTQRGRAEIKAEIEYREAGGEASLFCTAGQYLATYLRDLELDDSSIERRVFEHAQEQARKAAAAEAVDRREQLIAQATREHAAVGGASGLFGVSLEDFISSRLKDEGFEPCS